GPPPPCASLVRPDMPAYRASLRPCLATSCRRQKRETITGRGIDRGRRSRAPRPACRAPELARQLAGARDAALHRVRGDALWLVLHRVFLHPRCQRVSVAARGLRATALRRRGEYGNPGHFEFHVA